jgi:pantoate--beta-alanine ligase
MEVIRNPLIIQDSLGKDIMKGRTIGFVPTMGALHEGHLSLVRRAREENDISVVSIFVNPLQFGQSEDFATYPRDIEGDMLKLRAEGIDILFLPEPSSIYPNGFSTYVYVEGLSERLCGAFRPGHFRGVTTIVTKLLNIVRPSRAYFGQKDYQQSVIIKRLVKDLNMPLEIVVSPTIRESDGLAMSSRNLYLSEEERAAAPVLYRALSKAEEDIKSGIRDLPSIKRSIYETLRAEPLVRGIDYASLYDPQSLEELTEIGGPVLIAGRIKIGSTTLIDNILI